MIVEPYKLPYKQTIKNDLETKQKIVGGLIEVTSLLDDEDVALICNEEGKMYGMPLNRDIGYDIIAGTFIIAGEVDEEGEFTSLTEEQIEKYKNRFNQKSIADTEAKVTAILLKNKIKNDKDLYEGGLI